jgi:ribosomal protein S18 acetylase RimI-like enzyme
VSADAYRRAFVARCELERNPGRLQLDEPGLCGLLPSAVHPSCRLLVTDDRAYDVLAAVLPDAEAGRISVFAAAARCAELVAARPGWKFGEATAMSCTDLRSVPTVPLPAELTLRPVRRTADEPRQDVPLEAAVAAVLRANPGIEESLDTLAGYLRSLPPPTRLLCALDDEGGVRATSGASTFGAEGHVFFVNTDPDWRSRGIGRAMTAAALHASRASGARRASLDASDAGQSIYLRLGFDIVSRTTRFFRSGDGR